MDMLKENRYTTKILKFCFFSFQYPKTPEAWATVAEEYWQRWNFPHCVGALDGKHVKIHKPACSGATYFNYKHTHSVILLAVADANYRFLFVDIGSQGRCSDAGVFSESLLNKALEANSLNFPRPTQLPGTEKEMPYWLLADDAFPLREHILKPFPQRNLSFEQCIFNYRLSRARRCIENAFGILANRFRVMLNPICVKPERINHIVLACCALHNMLRTIAPMRYVLPADVVINHQNHGDVQLQGAKVTSRRSATQAAKQIRDYLCTNYFFSEEGSVPWQENMI